MLFLIFASQRKFRSIRPNSVTNEIISAGGSSITLIVDLNNNTEIKTAVSQATQTFKGIDIVINNYSILNLKPSGMITSE